MEGGTIVERAQTARGARTLVLPLAIAGAATAMVALILVLLWLAPGAGSPWRAVPAVGALTLAAGLAIVWRRRVRAARWLSALDAFAAREIARAHH
jgi:hypothetical protein